VIDGGTNFMVAGLRTLIRVRAIVVIVFLLLLGATYWTVKRVPTGFVPDEDQGYVLVLIQAPPGASLDYTMGIIKQAEQVMLKNPDLRGMFAAGGFGFTGTAPNQGILFAQLKDFKDRPGEERSAKAVVGQLFGAFSQITGGMVIPFLPPAINGLGIFGGFEYQLLDQSGGAIGNLEATAQQLIAQGNQTPGLTALFTQFTANDPQIVVNIDREQAKSLGMSMGDITNTMQVLLGSAYVNDFDFNGRSYRVYVQADQQFRSNPSTSKSTTSARPPGAWRRSATSCQSKRRLRRSRSAISTCSAPLRSMALRHRVTARVRRCKSWDSCRTALCRRDFRTRGRECRSRKSRRAVSRSQSLGSACCLSI
jgi:HAE1 family hydrophobic/amphiphilic exporter-1